MIRKYLFIFWGGMDALYLIHFFWLPLSQGRFPFYHDLQAFLSFQAQHGVYAILLFSLSCLLVFSILISALLFLRQKRSACLLAYLQTPLRLLLATPSLMFLPWLPGVQHASDAGLSFSLLLFSECVKVFSLIRVNKGR